MSPTAPLICLLRITVTAAAAAAAIVEPSRQQCPCAYLERGGFWDSPTAVSLGVSDRVYRERRCSCKHEVNCNWNWRTTDKSLTLAWLGSKDIRDSEIQLQFCAPIFPPSAPTCSTNANFTSNETAFTLRQKGLWIDLREAPRCRCANEGGPATIRRFRYAQPLEMGERLRHQTVEFACGRMAECSTGQPCYRESLNEQGRRIGGRVQCACPPDSHCPIYTGQGARPAAEGTISNNSTNPDAEMESNDGEPGIELVCITAEP